MIKEQDEKVLTDTVVLLEHESKLDSVSVVVKIMVERTLALLHKSTNFLDDLPFILPSIDVFQSFHRLDREIRRSIRSREYHRAHELLVDYIDLLPRFVPDSNLEQIRKLILANLLASSEQPSNILVEEKVEVYTSSEAAEILGVTDQTIRRYCEKGKYPEAYQTEGGHWRIPQRYFKITPEQAKKRKAFEQQLNEFNASTGEAAESEWI
ncbi:helix-turn-helix domain-containing protein [Paenibacillus athensensis]|nr:helix-turn-helix domain-containing protein [Paenibacillus athensensis]MCD1261839.1 helix-turn-helix domain-containing protein [Paenibacillus athensensis]